MLHAIGQGAMTISSDILELPASAVTSAGAIVAIISRQFSSSFLRHSTTVGGLVSQTPRVLRDWQRLGRRRLPYRCVKLSGQKAKVTDLSRG
jgi:hypothetical protein